MWMKIINFKFLVLIMIISSCTMKTTKDISHNLNADIDSLKNRYAPDTRITLWNISIKSNDDTITVNAELENHKAAEQLKKILADKYPEVVSNIKIFPEKDTDRFVHALINNSVTSIRSDPKHRAELVNQASLGTPIRIFKQEENWYLIQTPNKYLGWVNEDDIVLLNKDELNDYKKYQKLIYKKQYGSAFSEPNIHSQVISDLVIGCVLPVTDTLKDFYKVKYPDGRVAFVLKNEVENFLNVFNGIVEEKKLVSTAKKFLGIPYLWGGMSSKAIDCSGFTSEIYFLNGVILQRDASQQIKYGTEVTTKFEYKDLIPGDLLFFTDISYLGDKEKSKRVTHVGMYIGDTEFIHASGKVKINSMDTTRKDFNPLYKNTYLKAMRMTKDVGSEYIQKIKDNNFYKATINTK